METPVEPQLAALLEDIARSAGVRLYHAGLRGQAVCIQVEAEGGTSLELCARFSRSLAQELKAQNSPYSEYSLEVSSPGVERRLYRPEDYQRAAGSRVRVKAAGGVVEGVLVVADSEAVQVRTDAGEERRIGYSELKWGQVVVPDSELFSNANRKAG